MSLQTDFLQSRKYPSQQIVTFTEVENMEVTNKLTFTELDRYNWNLFLVAF